MNLEEQLFEVPQERRERYGEITTDFDLIDEMLDQLPVSLFQNPNLKWLDVGSGRGHFTKVLFNRLYLLLAPALPDPVERRTHILHDMLYMIELNDLHRPHLLSTFGEKANVITGDFLTYQPHCLYDVIIGNPPYNSHGVIKVPSNNERDKRDDGQTVWPLFVRHAVSLLAPGGYLNFITPSMWLRPDKAKTYDFMHTFTILRAKCMSSSETSKAFHGHAQTPTCIFTLRNIPTTEGVGEERTIELYDRTHQSYVPYEYFTGESLPLFGASIIKKLRPYVREYGHAAVYKTNLPPRDVKLSPHQDKTTRYPNIKTCLLENSKPKLVIEYSNKKLKYRGVKKLVMAHKMYGFPYNDAEGVYGISSRDNYIMVIPNSTERKRWQDFLSTKFALFIFEAARYRMRYLEREAFMFIPDILAITGFPELITDECLARFFGLTSLEKDHVLNLHKKEYKKIEETSS